MHRMESCLLRLEGTTHWYVDPDFVLELAVLTRTRVCIGDGNDLRNPKVRLLNTYSNRLSDLPESHYPDACVVWVDAHADINTVETTDSGKAPS